MKETGIKESVEVLDAFDLLVEARHEALQDGVINYKDIPVGIKLINRLDLFLKAVKGAEKIPKEIKDIDKDEAARIGYIFARILAKL